MKRKPDQHCQLVGVKCFDHNCSEDF